MKSMNLDELAQRPGRRLADDEPFGFACHAGLACFNRCCRNLNLFLYPYDVLRLKNNLGIDADAFLDQHVDIVLRPGNFFPEVVLRMRNDAEHTCPFLTTTGCQVYADRPDTCRCFPVEMGRLYDPSSDQRRLIYFFRPPSFCLGRFENRIWTVKTWCEDQQAALHNQMTARWADIKRLFQADPWAGQGPYGPKGKMAFMAAYNMERFRDFVFNSSFLKRFWVKREIVQRMERDETELLQFGFAWIAYATWGINSPLLRAR
jgi:hypothetical protein